MTKGAEILNLLSDTISIEDLENALERKRNKPQKVSEKKRLYDYYFNQIKKFGTLVPQNKSL